MKQIKINSLMSLPLSFFMVFTCVFLVLDLSGCVSVPNSPTPRFYMLETVNENQSSKKINIASDALIGVGPVKIPEYLDRPQIVTQGKEKMLKFA